MRNAPILLGLFTLACGGGAGEADVSGSIEGVAFDSVASVFHGNNHIVFVDRAIDCLDMAWVDDVYVDGEDPTGGDQQFIALQFSFQADTPLVGTFSVSPDAPVKGYGLMNDPKANDGAFTFHRVRGGTITITESDTNTVKGEFSAEFSSDTTQGTFESESCRNLR